jgi:hypothetical protein
MRQLFESADTYAHSPFVEVYLVANLTSVGANAKLPFDGVLTNEVGAWDVANKWYQCTKAGRLLVNASACMFFPTVPETGLLEVKVETSGGSVYQGKRFGQYNDYNGSVLSIVGSTVVNVNFGDRVWIQYLASRTSSIVLGGSVSSQLTHACFSYTT